MLKFFGISTGLSKLPSNSAYIEYNGDLIIIDCSMDTCRALMDFDLSKYNYIYVFITHTHSDHCGGVGMLAFYAHFHYDKEITILMPSMQLVDDFRWYLKYIEGVDTDYFDIMCALNFIEPWLLSVISTKHSDELEGKCFGYCFEFYGVKVVYTGDTKTILNYCYNLPLNVRHKEGKEMQYISKLSAGDYLYTELCAYQTNAHLNIDVALPILKEQIKKGVKVYAMHISNVEEMAALLENTGVEIAKLYNKTEQKSKKVVIVINGRGGCGKDTLIGSLVDKYKIMNVSSIDRVKELAKQCGWDGNKDIKSRQFLADLKQLCISYNDMPLNDILEKYRQFENGDYDIMFVHIREGDEIDKLKQHIKCRTLLVTSDRTDKATYTNLSDIGVDNYDYDYVFNNSVDIDTATKSFGILIDLIMRN